MEVHVTVAIVSMVMVNVGGETHTVKHRDNGLLGTALKGLLYPKSIISKLG